LPDHDAPGCGIPNPSAALKLNGYAKAAGIPLERRSDCRPRSWYVDVQENAIEDEMIFLKTEIYLRVVEPRIQVLTPFNRFSARL